MAKVDFRTLSTKEKNVMNRKFWGNLEKMKQSDALDLLKLFMTESEELMFMRRLDIAKHLIQGTPQLEICEILRVGLPTIQYVDTKLREDFPEYRSVLPGVLRSEKKKKERKEKKPTKGGYVEPPSPFTMKWLKTTYPLHALIFNILLNE